MKREKLTQTALATELAIASWTTVSKFFNGKPVDRSLFLEICERLNLDWQDIAAPFLADQEDRREVKGEISPELAAVQCNSQCARTALNPYILPRIRREALLSKCIIAIRRGVEGQRRVIPILGAAGYGKSTLLGTIYDELELEFTSSGKGWVALARCNDFIESVENFPLEVGEKVSGTRKSIVEVATTLAESHGRGVLLIDTLDLVLESKLVPVLRRLLFQLLEVSVTVVFTCRDHDYQDFFTPYPESFAGFFESVERHLVAKFSSDEVRETAYGFMQMGIGSPEGSEDFATKIINLSANSQSLAEITHNPLLLALLCDLFAKDENVPEDLTVSQLYEKFWHFRIAQGRKHHNDLRRIGMVKRNLCLKLAQMMYCNSGERLRDFVFESQLELDETQFQAYSELKSDGVLTDMGGERVTFFHQTFIEYAIARWIESTPEGETAKNELLQFLETSENPYARHYIWSVLRQLLNLVNLEEFYRLANSFD
ncbi:MAG: hypothetical protein PUP92_24605 [Rhizonema sp. PD38]|nr:hypothetical protein [Rhizonema sp. PD38]